VYLAIGNRIDINYIPQKATLFRQNTYTFK